MIRPLNQHSPYRATSIQQKDEPERWAIEDKKRGLFLWWVNSRRVDVEMATFDTRSDAELYIRLADHWGNCTFAINHATALRDLQHRLDPFAEERAVSQSPYAQWIMKIDEGRYAVAFYRSKVGTLATLYDQNAPHHPPELNTTAIEGPDALTVFTELLALAFERYAPECEVIRVR